MDVGGSTSSSFGGAPLPFADEREHGVVHDLGNLIQIASSALGAISRSRTSRDPSLEPILARARTALERAGALVRQTMVRTHAPSMIVRKVPVDEDVASCLREIEGLIRWVCEPDIRLTLEVAPGLPRIRCSRVDLQAAVLNLVINARDAVSPGGALSVTVGPAAAQHSLLTSRSASPMMVSA